MQISFKEMENLFEESKFMFFIKKYKFNKKYNLEILISDMIIYFIPTKKLEIIQE